MKNKEFLLLIPARKGSKGVKKKNIINISGKPLIAYTIEHALDSGLGDVIVSTDSSEIADISAFYGAEVPFLRSKKLSSDNAATIDVIFDFLDRYPVYENIILLQPTSPLRDSEDIKKAVSLFQEKKMNALISTKSIKFNENFIFSYEDYFLSIDKPVEVTRRQEWSKAMIPNGAIFIANCKKLRKYRSFYMRGTGYYEMKTAKSIDIDTNDDLELVRKLLM